MPADSLKGFRAIGGVLFPEKDPKHSTRLVYTVVNHYAEEVKKG